MPLEVTHRIDRCAVDVHLEVQVGTGGDTGGAGVADRVAGADSLPDGCIRCGQVLVQRAQLIVVLNDDVVTAGAGVGNFGDNAAGCRCDVTAVVAGDVDALMVAAGTPGRGIAAAKTTADVAAGRNGPLQAAAVICAGGFFDLTGVLDVAGLCDQVAFFSEDFVIVGAAGGQLLVEEFRIIDVSDLSVFAVFFQRTEYGVLCSSNEKRGVT